MTDNFSLKVLKIVVLKYEFLLYCEQPFSLCQIWRRENTRFGGYSLVTMSRKGLQRTTSLHLCKLLKLHSMAGCLTRYPGTRGNREKRDFCFLRSSKGGWVGRTTQTCPPRKRMGNFRKVHKRNMQQTTAPQTSKW